MRIPPAFPAAVVALFSLFVLDAQQARPDRARGVVLERYGLNGNENLSPRFRTFYVTWGATEKEEFTRYLGEARPDVVQAGWYGPMFFGYVGQKQSTGYPMQLPVAGVDACMAQWRELHRKVRESGGKSVAHFTVTNVIRGAEKEDENKPGFFADWYGSQWPEHLLGAKPAADWTDLVSKDASGKVLIDKHYVQYNSLCVNNPATREMLKVMVRAAIDNGVDGLMTTYNYRRACACPHCQAAFKSYLKTTFTPEEIRSHFRIENLEAASFERIPGQTPGYPAEADISPLTLAAYQWSALAYKAAWDEVFLREGRSKKPDLILGQWDHLGNVGVTEERSFLPVESFAKGENYLWYSGNHYNAEVRPGDDNDGWLNGLYLRALAGEKPYVIGRYDGVRIRVGQAEAMALGGAGTGLNNTVTDPASYAVLKHNLGFAKAHENDVLDTHVRSVPDEPGKEVQPVMLADTALIIPRQSAWAGKKHSFEIFRRVGTELVRRQRPIQMIPDEVLDSGLDGGGAGPGREGGPADGFAGRLAAKLERFRVLVLPEVLALTDNQLKALQVWMRSREENKLVIVGDAASLNSLGRPWAIASVVDGAQRMSWTGGFDRARVVRFSPDEVTEGTVDWESTKPAASRPNSLAVDRQAAFELWTKSGSKREPLVNPNSLRVALYRHPGGSHVLHLVNYARNVEGAKFLKKHNTDAELPVASSPVWVRVPRESGLSVNAARVLTPDLKVDGSPEDVVQRPEKDANGDCWILVGPVTVYRIVEMW